MGVDAGFPKAGPKAIGDVVPTAMPGGEVFGRRSGRSDWMAGEVKGGEGKEESRCERSPEHADACQRPAADTFPTALQAAVPSLLPLTAVFFRLFFGLSADLVLQ